MIITESAVNLQATHQKTTVERETESFRAWIDGAQNPQTDADAPTDKTSFQHIVDKVRLSAESLEMAHSQMHSKRLRDSTMPDDASLMARLKSCAKGKCAGKNQEDDTEDDTVIADSRLNLMKQLVEMLSGKKVHLFDASQINEEKAAKAAAEFTAAHDDSAQPRNDSDGDAGDSKREGWGVAYDYSKTTVASEQTHFQADGVVRTKDGREIAFSSSLQMERERIEVTSFQLRAGDARLVDPLVLNFNGNAAALTEDKVNFDLDSDGIDESISFVADGSGFLVLDKNHDGIVNNGSELFGPSTGNGFAELATHDDDGNGWIDEADAVYNDLRIWQGTANGAGLKDLRTGNVGAIYLGAASTPFENRTSDNTLLGQTVATGVFLTETGQTGTIQQVDLVS